VREADYKLVFKIPTAAELDLLRRNDKTKTKEEVQRIRSMKENLEKVIEDIDSNRISIHDLPKTLRTQVVNRLQPKLDLRGDSYDEL
jgi:hypothetical protein